MQRGKTARCNDIITTTTPTTIFFTSQFTGPVRAYFRGTWGLGEGGEHDGNDNTKQTQCTNTR